MNLEDLYLLTRSLGSDVSRAALNQAFAQAESEVAGDWSEVWRKRLELVAAQLGIIATPYYASIPMIADMVQPGAVALTVARVGDTTRWVLLEESDGNTVNIRDANESTSTRWVGESVLAQELGWSSSQQLHHWLIWQQKFPCQGAVTETQATDHHGHQDDAAHGHHGHAIPPLTRLFRILKPDRADIWAAIWYSVGISILMLATPITVEALVSTVAFGTVLQPLFVLSMVLLGCLLFAGVFRAMQTYLIEILQRRIFVRVMADLSQRLARVKVSEFDSNHGPELVNRFFDVLTIQKVSATLLMDGITIVLQATIGMIVVAFYHPLLLVLDLVLIATIVFIIFGLGRGAIAASIRESICKYRVVEWLQELARHPVAFKLGGGTNYAMQRAISWPANISLRGKRRLAFSFARSSHRLCCKPRRDRAVGHWRLAGREWFADARPVGRFGIDPVSGRGIVCQIWQAHRVLLRSHGRVGQAGSFARSRIGKFDG